MKRKNMCSIIIPVVLLLLFLSKGPLAAAPYYAGKILTIVVGSAPGGGYNNMARLLAQHLPKHIPGRPNIIISNMPGASGVIAANYIYNISKPNGLTIGAIQGSSVLGQAVKAQGIKFDLTKFRWIGSSSIEPGILVIRFDYPYKTFEALVKAKQPIYLHVTGAAGMNTQFISILKAFALPQIIPVYYPSNAEAFLAIERKEIDGMSGAYFSVKHLIDRGIVRLILRGRSPVEEIKNIPVDEDFTTDPIGKTVMAIRSSSDVIGRPYIAPPGTPAEIMNILREAFFKVTNDPAFKEDAKKSLMQISYVSAEECLKNINFIISQPNNIIEELSKYVK